MFGHIAAQPVFSVSCRLANQMMAVHHYADRIEIVHDTLWLLITPVYWIAIKRNIRSIRYQIQAARFLVQRHLQGFDFSQSKVDQQLIQQLVTMEFTAAAQNLVLIGGTGTGKTIATI